jgi:hypothetical protein
VRAQADAQLMAWNIVLADGGGWKETEVATGRDLCLVVILIMLADEQATLWLARHCWLLRSPVWLAPCWCCLMHPGTAACEGVVVVTL